MNDWVTFVGVLIPLLTISGSAVAYIVQLRTTKAEKRLDDFFALMGQLESDKPIASKLAAIYELRRFPEHKDFSVRFCSVILSNSVGPGAKFLEEEAQSPIDYFKTI